MSNELFTPKGTASIVRQEKVKSKIGEEPTGSRQQSKRNGNVQENKGKIQKSPGQQGVVVVETLNRRYKDKRRTREDPY